MTQNRTVLSLGSLYIRLALSWGNTDSYQIHDGPLTELCVCVYGL